jgi:hypothetical protein
MLTDQPAHRVVATVSDTPVGDIDVLTWSPADAHIAEPLPMLFAHDGPELDVFAELTALIGSCVASGRLPRMRVTLLAPGDRNPRYAASAAYAAGARRPRRAVCKLRAHPSEHPPVLARAEPRRACGAACRMDPPGDLRGAAHAVGVVLHAGVGPAGEAGSSSGTQVVGFVDRVHTSPAPSRPEVALGVGHPGGEPVQQRPHGRSGWESWACPCARRPSTTGTTSPVGVTCSTCCCPIC